MKKCQFLLSMVIVVLGFTACQKGGNIFQASAKAGRNAQLAQIIAAKRNFYASLSTSDPGSSQTQSTGVHGFNHIRALEKITRWDKAQLLRISVRDVVGVP